MEDLILYVQNNIITNCLSSVQKLVSCKLNNAKKMKYGLLIYKMIWSFGARGPFGS